MKPVKDIKIEKGQTVDDLVKQMANSGGFMAKNLSDGVDIIKDFEEQEDCLRFLSFPADIISTGARGVIKDMVKKNMFDVLITTCGTLDHDLARSFKDYYQGKFRLDDTKLYEKKMHRLGNVIVPIDSYGLIIEEKVKEFFKDIVKEGGSISTHELCWEIGKHLNEDSILYWAWKNKIPVIIPGITDGSVGYNIWEMAQNKDFKFDFLKDETLLSDLIWNSKKRAALIIGGGISKHHVIWWNQFKDGLDYAVYITTAQEYDGSLSGAQPREAISWGKLSEKAKYVTIYADATIVLPIIYSSLV